MPYAILRTAKLKSGGNLGSLNEHLHRLRPIPNADHELTHLNQHLRGSTNLHGDVQARLQTVGCTVRKNAVLAVEHVLTFSPEFLDLRKVPHEGGYSLAVHTPDGSAKMRAFKEQALEWLDERYGRENVVHAVLHVDERTPHMHAVVVPIDGRGKLNCAGLLGDRQKMRDMQTSFAAKVAPLGLERGVEGSPAHHQRVQRFYGLAEQLTPKLEQEAKAQQVSAQVQERLRQAERSRGHGMGM